MSTTDSPRYRAMRFGVTEVDVRHAPGGVQYVRGVGAEITISIEPGVTAPGSPVPLLPSLVARNSLRVCVASCW